MDYKELIKNWHNKASDEDYFSKFVFEYLAFIAHLKTQLYKNVVGDRLVIQKLKQELRIKKIYLDKIQTKSSLKEDWNKIKNELDSKRHRNLSINPNNYKEFKWYNCSHNELNKQSEEEKGKSKGVIHSLNDWENMVEFWYSIRNNLFHGAKDPEIKRDQFLVEYGYKTLKELIEIFLCFLSDND